MFSGIPQVEVVDIGRPYILEQFGFRPYPRRDAAQRAGADVAALLAASLLDEAEHPAVPLTNLTEAFTSFRDHEFVVLIRVNRSADGPTTAWQLISADPDPESP